MFGYFQIRDLVDLAVEYSLITSTCDFHQRSVKAQRKILETMAPIWKQILEENPV